MIEFVDLSDEEPRKVHVADEPVVLDRVGRQACARCGFELLAVLGNIVRVNGKYLGFDEDEGPIDKRMWKPGAHIVMDGAEAATAECWEGDLPPDCREAAKA